MGLNKTYKIETVQDIFECVSKENIERFMLNFYKLFDTLAEVKETVKSDLKAPYFIWADDGKMDITFNINNEDVIEIKSKNNGR